MAGDRPDPGEFLDRAQKMLRELFGDPGGEGGSPWSAATGERARRGPSPEERRENLTFALATRAVEALEDLALNVAAIRQRLERRDAEGAASAPAEPTPDGGDAGRDPV
ncbi:hypothetical protein [Trujillonella humicola]|uniref:hypothetical protein n=1 Tax=Trujillonella humicola TaxID=3383699 RepID=UPI0039064BB2